MIRKIEIIDYKLARDFIIDKHYAGRIPSISYAFGLFENEVLVAVCTFGKPASNPLCRGVCGDLYSDRVYELNRLVGLEGTENISQFVGGCLRELKPLNLIIISYADTGMGHVGIVYQACNFMYTGKTKARTDKYTEGNKHPRHYTDNNKHLRKVRTSKHRYIYFACNKTWKKIFTKALNYNVEDYPKGKSARYKLGNFMKTKVINKENNEVFYT